MLISCGGDDSAEPPPSGPVAVTLTSFVSGLSSPVDLQMPDDGSGRFFVVEQAGTIRIISGGAVQAGNFLDIHTKVTAGGELGLLGVTFHPNYSSDGRFFVNYTRTSGGQLQSVIAEYSVSSNPNQADAGSERILLTVNQPDVNHKAGQLAFGPDGLLYFTFGDGGGTGDPSSNGQNLFTRLGKMLRIDVDSTPDVGLQYKVPPDNPFVGGGGLPEIYAYGFRNPWRFSFDNSTGRLFCDDVGQSAVEEIDLVTKGGNFGWKTMEGSQCFSPSSGCNMTGLISPIAEYSHSEGQAVIGGYVYKGTQIPELANHYIFGDLNGKIFDLRENPSSWTRSQLLSTGRTISSFGRDANGEIYVVDLSGSILKLAPQ
jgi:glucose/arabinose dehydrogenase